jgi:hypothetical protein
MAAKPTVLLAYVHNAGRSQMAAALLARHAAGAVEVRSAGSEPADQIMPAIQEGRHITSKRPGGAGANPMWTVPAPGSAIPRRRTGCRSRSRSSSLLRYYAGGGRHRQRSYRRGPFLRG